ncbi:MAG: M23 family metallopeptidase [Caldilineales bacterium]|nr:M23 family metallopeptidase [Caldilineales bacterium]
MYTEPQRVREEPTPEVEPGQQPELQSAPYIPTSPPTPQPQSVPTPKPKPVPETTPEPPESIPEPPSAEEPELEQPPVPEPEAPVKPEPETPEITEPATPPIALRHPVPGAPVTQWFGKNPQMYKKWGLAGHEGIDFGCRKGTKVSAAADGKVLHCGTSAGYGPLGIYVVLEHHWGDVKGFSVYAHLSEVDKNITVGKKLSVGAKLGESGDTGNVTGPHLHFALLLCDQELDGYVGPKNMGSVWWHDPKPFIAEFNVAGTPNWIEDIDPDHVCGGPPIDYL